MARIVGGSTTTQGSQPSTIQIQKDSPGGLFFSAIGVTLISGNDENAGGLLLDSSASNALRIDVDPDNNRNGTYIRFATDGTTRARIDSDGLKFNSDTASTNALDDYEEGAWTPDLRFGGGTTGITYANRFGKYVKIGRLLWVTCRCTLSNKGQIQVLPKFLD